MLAAIAILAALVVLVATDTSEKNGDPPEDESAGTGADRRLSCTHHTFP